MEILNIVIYSTPTCSWCKKLKSYLKSSGFIYKELTYPGTIEPLATWFARQVNRVSRRPGSIIIQLSVFNKAKIDKLLGIK
ncbi:MAG: glutaredoxin domain-containing protein [Candidatus Cloacimonetes bacterium]|nr:hypothetical protein [Candidatus Cloacimonadota bacterium]MDD2507377.1 glutaredoxin domain-containing protein [Candidatus Cloacimonadota bacterium]MDD4560675.1 glutaredoxin domain-containing protein [Candidatus Cloacimonadota bacterium]